MRRLSSPIGDIPRAYADSRRSAARLYRSYCLSIQAAWGPLPPIAMGTLREAGRASVELERLGADMETARRLKRRRDCTRIRKQQFMLREQLARLERRLEELASKAAPDRLTAVTHAIQAANR